MTLPDDEPELAPPLPMAARQASRLVPILLLLGIIGGGVYASTGIDHSEAGKAPSRPEDLSANIVTFVAPDDRAGVAAAVAALKVPTAQRAGSKENGASAGSCSPTASIPTAIRLRSRVLD
jgi:hypothetical protein